MVATVKILPRARRLSHSVRPLWWQGSLLLLRACSEPARDLEGAGRDGRTDGRGVSSAKDFD